MANYPAVSLEPWRLFWAKTDRHRRGAPDYDREWTRPLWAHLLDVGHAAMLLWERHCPDYFRRRASVALGLSDAEAGVLLSFWIGVHDWGKSIPSFQFQERSAAYLDRMQAQGFALTAQQSDARTPPHHGHATIALVFRALRGGEIRDGDLSTPLLFDEGLAAFVGFHHGRLLHLRAWRAYASGFDALGDGRWRDQQHRLFQAVHAAWAGRYGLATPRTDLAPAPDWLLGLAGWATLADWLGSLSDAFDRHTGTDPVAYLDASRAGAERAFARAGFDAPAALVSKPFADLFPEIAHPPRPVQRVLLDLPLPESRDVPTLTIVEAPTGEGKTEAALALAARQQDRGGRDRPDDLSRGGGLYIGLPTQATANGLFERATAFLARAHHADAGSIASFRLAYGRAELYEPARELLADPDELAALYDESDSSPTEARVRTLRWFLGSKRALLAPYGLGTLDQGLLGVLYSRHFFLRLFGLAGKTVIVDEIHAYDVYTSALIRRLLPWLRALGAHVILLSATLPARHRRKLLKAWDDRAAPPAEPASEKLGYPAVWTSAEGVVRVRAGRKDGLTASRTQRTLLKRRDIEPEAVSRLVMEAVETNAVIAVVCNTVKRAQAVLRAIETALAGRLAPADLVLFHARFVQRERSRIEKHVLARFGKGRPPGPAILVGTQVVEQSLDLDVDVMLSDLAPIDLLLQRAGRLHRHDRADRPEGYADPRLYWLCPAWEAGALPDVERPSGGGHVYRRTVLWRTAHILDGRPLWTLPEDYRPLIEAVYGTDAPPEGLNDEAVERWETTAERERGRETLSERSAAARIIERPHDLGRMLVDGRFELADDDDEQAHPDLKALTREGDSVEVVVLHADDSSALFLDPACRLPAPLALRAPKKALPTEAVCALLGATVRLSHDAIIRHLRRSGASLPHDWRVAADATPSLRGLHPVVMRDGIWDDAGPVVRWHDRLGLLIETS